MFSVSARTSGWVGIGVSNDGLMVGQVVAHVGTTQPSVTCMHNRAHTGACLHIPPPPPPPPHTHTHRHTHKYTYTHMFHCGSGSCLRAVNSTSFSLLSLQSVHSKWAQNKAWIKWCLFVSFLIGALRFYNTQANTDVVAGAADGTGFFVNDR